ncbi:MAG: CBS domain-containing protein [Candidatus Microsaccharimonas sp.]
MSVLLAILALITFISLVLTSAMHPTRSKYSLTELKRRSKHSKQGLLELDRYELYPAMVTVFRIKRAVSLVVVVCLLVGAFGWLLGVFISLLVAVFYPAIARVRGVQQAGTRIYNKIEPRLLDFTARFERFFRTIREPSIKLNDAPLAIHSREDLAELVQHSKEVIGENERVLLASALAFPDKTVASVMSPRSVIDFIKGSEFLGPLVLDELHSIGHSRLPVIADDLDHVIGILHLRDLLSLDVKRSTTAEKAMEAKVYYIHEDDSLEHTLAAFLKTRHHLFIVINQNRETVGLLTIEDVLEALIGRHIVDEDDIHADLRAVATHESRYSNVPKGHIDL